MSVFQKEVLFELENCKITVYTDGKIEIVWNSVIPPGKESSIIARLNKYLPTKRRWKIHENIASTELNSFEAHLLESNESEQERLQTAANIPID